MTGTLNRVCRAVAACAAVAGAALAGVAHAEVNVGDVVHVQDSSAKAKSGRYDRRTGEMRYTATMINLTPDEIVGPVYVYVTNISRGGIHDTNHEDMFSDGRGVYRLDVDMAPQARIKKEFTFHNPEKHPFEFDVEIWVTSALNPDIEPVTQP